MEDGNDDDDGDNDDDDNASQPLLTSGCWIVADCADATGVLCFVAAMMTDRIYFNRFEIHGLEIKCFLRGEGEKRMRGKGEETDERRREMRYYFKEWCKDNADRVVDFKI